MKSIILWVLALSLSSSAFGNEGVPSDSLALDCSVRSSSSASHLQLTAVSERRARALFSEVSNLDLPFQHLTNGCDARSYMIGEFLHARGIEVGKAFAEAAAGQAIRVVEGGRAFEWGFHTAPVVSVRTAQGLRLFVIDPSLFTRLVSLDEWTARLGEASGSSVSCVSLGSRFQYEPPVDGTVATSFRPLTPRFAEESIANQRRALEAL